MVKPYAVAGDLRRVAPLVILVMAVHAALLALPLRSASVPGMSMPSSAMQVRMLAAQANDSSANPGAALPVSGNDPAALAPAAVTAGTAPAAVSPPQPAFGLVRPGSDSDADYYPRASLSQGPNAVDAIVVDYPPIANDSGHHVSQLSLFIDETGRVARVRVEGPELPPALEQAARAAFMGARFRAGEVDGHAVKSRIRIEVEFDNRPPGGLK